MAEKRNPPLPGRGRHIAALVGIALLAAAVFLVDRFTQVGSRSGTLYILVVVVGLWLPFRWYPWVAAALCTPLVILGGATGGVGVLAAASLRVFAVADLWIVAILGTLLQRATARQMQNKHRRLFEQASLGMYESSADGRFLTVNPALVKMLGYDAADELLRLRFDPDVYADPSEYHRLVRRHSELGVPVNGVRTQWKRRDGSTISIRLNGVPADRPFGPPGGFTMVVEDVTAQDALEAQLRQAQKMEAVGQLTSGIAHDFNNVLTVVLATSELLGLELPPDSPLRTEVTSMRSAAERGAAMVRRLLSFSRRDALTFTTFDVQTAVGETVELLHRVLPSNVEIVWRCDPEAGQMRADRGAVEQILVNLATNARDAMPDGGRLTITGAQTDLDPRYVGTHPWVTPGRYVGISVTDTGTGMDEETQRHIFEPFYTRKQREKGTGLGMAMVYGLMKQHNGMVHVYSEPGQGTTVKAYFPVAHDPMVTALAEASPAPLPRGRELVLIVDDDSAVRRLAERVLSSHGYRVITAGDGEEGLERLAAARANVSLVLCDLVMPRLGGRQFGETVRERDPDLPILFMSGYTDDRLSALEALSRGLPVLLKPWSASDLLHRVREAIDGPGHPADRGRNAAGA